MAELPTGTVTFLFTDIEGSTRLLERLGGEYEQVLAEHRRLIRAAVSAHAGVEVDTQGDAFLCAFQRASDAVAAAQDARALKKAPVDARIAAQSRHSPRWAGYCSGVRRASSFCFSSTGIGSAATAWRTKTRSVSSKR